MDTAPNPIPSYVATILRSVLSFLGGLIVAKGIASTEQVAEITGAVMVLVPIVWGLVQKRNAHVDLKAAIAAPAGSAG